MSSTKSMKLSLENKLALKITLISVLIITLVVSGVMFLQYYFVQRDAYAYFERESQSYRKNIIASKVLSGNVLEKLKVLETEDTYDGNINDLSQAIVFDPNNTVILNLYYTEITDAEKSMLLSLPKDTPTHIDLQGSHLLAYSFTDMWYTIIYSQYTYDPIEYYKDLLRYMLIWWGIILTILYGVSLYFARLSIRPIREHNAALESYNRNLAHEMRTPLSVIRGDLDMLELTQDMKFIESSREEIESMENMIDGLLFLAKPTTSEVPLQSIDIVSETRDIISKYEENIIFKSSEKSISKMVDPELYKRLMMNLTSNAIKYKSTGDIHIQVEKNTITVSNPVEKDLTKKELAKLTELFYQADSSRHSEGYGLGLAMVKKICEVFSWKMTLSCRDHIFVVKIDTTE